MVRISGFMLAKNVPHKQTKSAPLKKSALAKSYSARHKRTLYGFKLSAPVRSLPERSVPGSLIS